MSKFWVIARLADPIENRCERYFNGYCAPRWVGETTTFLEDAMTYTTKEAAERDIAHLAPSQRLWTAIEKP